MKLRISCVVVGLLLVLSLAAQTASSGSTSSQVPPLIQFSNVATDEGGSSLSGVVSLTFSLYAGPQGGEPLWTETQNNVQLDPTGHYSVQLGITKPNGVPTTLFTSGEARWLGVQLAEQGEQPRVLLLSVPYALKAGDAATIGGLPPSAFVLAAPQVGIVSAYATEEVTGQSVSPATATDVTTTGGTVAVVPVFTTATNIQNSLLTQTGTTAINVRGTLNLPAAGVATATAGEDSQPQTLAASAFNSSTSGAVTQVFQWQAEPVGNDTSAPTASLNLLFGPSKTKPAETGLHIASNGQITFAAGQTFPGAGGGSGTVTSVATGLGLKGGPITSSGTLTIDTTVVPRLNAANTFTVNQTVDGNLTATGVTATSASISDSLVMNSANGGPLAVSASPAGADAIFGYASASTGEGNGVYGLVNSSDPAAYGVSGFAASSTGSPVGVYGEVVSTSGIGVFGQSGLSESATGAGLASFLGYDVGAGVWGDSGSGGISINNDIVASVIGTADGENAGYFVNDSAGPNYTVVIATENAQGYPLWVGSYSNGASCSVDYDADLSCDGSVGGGAAVVVGGTKRKVALSAIESPQNWFEDAGEAELVNGKAVVTLDPEFIQTVNTGMDYKVFPVPNEDCKGLYVTSKTATSFEVRELGGGAASIRFDYRIMALRKNYENVRFADHTNDPDPMKMLRGGHAAGAANRQSHTPTKKPSLARPLTQTTAVR
jgi:hypothetical protein